MATAIVLSCQNSLKHQLDHETLTHRNPNPRPRPRPRPRRHSQTATTAPRRRKRSPTMSQPTVIKSPAANTNLVMGQVKILKRGEKLSEFKDKENSCCDDDIRRPVLKKMNDVDLIVSSINRLGPEPEIVMKQIGAGLEIFAGAGCSISPLPSSVPIPCFLEKNSLSF